MTSEAYELRDQARSTGGDFYDAHCQPLTRSSSRSKLNRSRTSRREDGGDGTAPAPPRLDHRRGSLLFGMLALGG